jgi:hypothetical protein
MAEVLEELYAQGGKRCKSVGGKSMTRVNSRCPQGAKSVAKAGCQGQGEKDLPPARP